MIAGARFNRIKIPVADPADPIDFKPDPDAKVRGRVELVEELEKCLGTSECTPADNWMFLGEYDGTPIHARHRIQMSVAIQIGAGANPARDYYPAVIDTSINTLNEYTLNQAVRNGRIPEGAWINYSRGSSFSDTNHAFRAGNFDTPLLIKSSVVIAVAAGNKGNSTQYTQHTLAQHTDLSALRQDYWAGQAILNTTAIFVYGLNNSVSDIHPRSSRCGSVVMNACIGVVYEGYPSFGPSRSIWGTSFSTALLSGSAWAMKSLWPHLTAQQIAAIMLTTARQLRGGTNEYTGVGALDFTALFKPVGPVAVSTQGSEALEVERGYLHLPGLDSFDNPEGVDSFARNFQLITSAVALEPDFSNFDLDRFIPAGPGSRLRLAVNKRSGGAEDAALAFGDTTKLVLSDKYIGLCRDGQATDLCIAASRREDFYSGQGSGSFRLKDTLYSSLAITHRIPIKNRLELDLGAAFTDGHATGEQLIGEVAGRQLQAEIALRGSKDTRARKTSYLMSIWASGFDGSMELLGKRSRLSVSNAGVRISWRIDF